MDNRAAPVHNRGVAMILVLWVLVILTVMAGSFSLNMRRGIDLVRNVKSRSTASPVAEAGIYYAMMYLTAKDKTKQWRSDGSVYEFPFAGARVRVSIHDEAGKIDINHAKAPLLANLLENVGESAESAASIADAIIDWRDTDPFRQINGAEEDDYFDAGLDYGPRNQSLQTVSELQMILGFSNKLYQSIKPYLTVYTGSNGIDPTRASAELLRVLPGVHSDTLEGYINERSMSAIAEPISPISLEGIGTVTTKGSVFSVYAEALLPGGDQAGVFAVLKKSTRSEKTPFQFLQWKTQFPNKNSLFMDSVQVVGQDIDDRS
ncbi:MAG: general secretion pathway protein GspK [Methylococcales bacterium]|nr:general secretion pathway protein GspK [Methylococcales bacterium]